MKIYIAGKVTGEPIAECTMKFGSMQKHLEKLGYEAVNPLAVVGTWQVTWQQAMKACIKALLDCDGVLALDDYTESRGAKIELDIAEEMGMPIFFSIEELQAGSGLLTTPCQYTADGYCLRAENDYCPNGQCNCPHEILNIKVVHICVTCETLATVCQGCKKQIGETKTEC
jgi:Domain of unknown function (DUF4406)